MVKRSSRGTLRPNFGTYHHSTPLDSEILRQKVRGLFTEAFRDLPFSEDDKLKMLDIGCGLGFLSCVCAEYYSESMTVGFDTFDDASLKDSSLAKAKYNAKILGLSKRIKFQKRDFFRSNYTRGKFDLFVANLVLHNFGRKRLIAYDRLASWTSPGSFILLGDLFFDYKTDFTRLTTLFGSVQERPSSAVGDPYKMLVLSEPKK